MRQSGERTALDEREREKMGKKKERKGEEGEM